MLARKHGRKDITELGPVDKDAASAQAGTQAQQRDFCPALKRETNLHLAGLEAFRIWTERIQSLSYKNYKHTLKGQGGRRPTLCRDLGVDFINNMASVQDLNRPAWQG